MGLLVFMCLCIYKCIYVYIWRLKSHRFSYFIPQFVDNLYSYLRIYKYLKSCTGYHRIIGLIFYIQHVHNLYKVLLMVCKLFSRLS